MPRLNIDFRGLIHLSNLSGGYFVTTIINQALPFLILPILTRYLAPSEYGNLALFVFYLTISHALAGAPVHNVISKMFFNETRENIAKTIGNAVLIVGLFSFTILLLILIFRNFLTIVLNLPLLWLALIPPASFAFIVFNMGLTVLRNAKKVITFGKHQIGNTLLNITASLLLIIVLLWGWHGRAMGIVFSYFISAMISLFYLKKHGYISFSISKNVIRIILQVIVPLIPNSFQSVVIAQAGVFFIQYYFTKELLGLYSIGFQISIVIKLLFDTINMSWTPYLYEQLSMIKSINELYLTRLFIALAIILSIGVIFINLAAGIILRVMTTPQYFNAVEFIPWLTLGFLFHGFSLLFIPILISNNKQKFISTVSFINMLLLLVLNVLFIELFGYIGVAYAFCLIYFFMFIALFYKARQAMPLPWLRAFKIWS